MTGSLLDMSLFIGSTPLGLFFTSGNRADLLKSSVLVSIDEKLSFYLAGLIEGDGSIKIPKTVRSEKDKIFYPSVTIVSQRFTFS